MAKTLEWRKNIRPRKRLAGFRLNRASSKGKTDAIVTQSPLYFKLHNNWLFADWLELSRVEEREIAGDSSRKEMALWIGAAHRQLGETLLANRFFLMARQWGADARDLEKIMRGLALRSLAHGYVDYGEIGKAMDVVHLALELNVNVGILPYEIEKWGKGARVSESRKSDSKWDVGDVFRKSFAKEMTNHIRQLQSFMAVQNFLTHGYLVPIDSTAGTWSISPDLALVLTSLLAQEDYDLIVEFGSGHSTELIALALQKRRHNRGSDGGPIHFAFEHSNEFYEKTKKQLMSSRVEDCVHLILAPLTPWLDPRGSEYLYYDPDVVGRVLDQVGVSPSRALVLVDGPPGTTGPHARYPAMPLLNSMFPECEFHYLIDDFNREDERFMVGMWRRLLGDQGREHSFKKLRLEKGACLLQVKKKCTGK